MANVAIISEKSKLKSQIEHYLGEVNYSVTIADEESDFATTNLILYDLTASQGIDVTIIKQIKTHTPLTPIIAIVNHGDVAVTANAIRAGAVNVIEIPLDQNSLIKCVEDGLSQNMDFQQDQRVIQQAIELLQSLQANKGNLYPLLSGHNPEQSAIPDTRSEVLQIGDLMIKINQEKVFYKKISIDLTHTQFRLLAILAKEHGSVVAFEELYFRLHGERIDRAASRTALSAHLSYLRTKLNDIGCGDYLENIRGRGYVLGIPDTDRSHSRKTNLDLMLEQLPIILWTTDDKLHITSIFGAGLTLLGLQPHDVIGLTPEEFFQSDVNHLSVFDAHHKALQGEANTFEQKIGNRIFHVYMEPSFSSKDQVTGCIGLAFDITEHKEVEQVYWQLVQQSLQGIIVFQDNRIVFANPAISEITGYTIDELISIEDPGQLIYSDDQSKVYENIQKHLAGEEMPSFVEFRIIHKDSSIRWIAQSAFVTTFRGRPAIQTSAIYWPQEK
ncbi:MAG: PAS domain S-box protein [Chloroflexota bacterium]